MNIKDVINFSRDILKNDERFKDIDTSENSAFYNIVLLPYAALMKPIFDLNDYTAKTLSYNNVSELTETQLDNLGKSVFAPLRRTDSLTTVEVNIYLSIASGSIEPLVVNTTDVFRTNQNQTFNPIKDYLFIYDTLPIVNGKRVATIVVAANQSYGKISENSITSASTLHPQLSFITNNRPSSTPISKETNEEYFDTIQRSFTTRNNLNLESLATNFKLSYPNITDIFATGYGDPEMQRDIAIAGKAWSGHFGGKTDVFVKSAIYPTSFQCTATRTPSSDGYYFYVKRYKGFDWKGIDGTNPSPQALMPWTKITLSDLPGATDLPITPIILFDWTNTTIGSVEFAKRIDGEVNYTVEVLPDPVDKFYGKNFRYSPYEQLKITVKTTTALSSTLACSLAYFTVPEIESYQDNASAENQRVLCNDILFKSFVPVEVRELVISYDNKYSVDEESWKTKIANQINSWNSNEPIRLVSLLKDFTAPVRVDEIWKDTPTGSIFPYDIDSTGQVIGTNVVVSDDYPCYAKMLMNQIDGSINVYVSTRQIYPLVKFGLSSTYRTCRYFIDRSNIKFIKGSW